MHRYPLLQVKRGDVHEPCLDAGLPTADTILNRGSIFAVCAIQHADFGRLRHRPHIISGPDGDGPDHLRRGVKSRHVDGQLDLRAFHLRPNGNANALVCVGESLTIPPERP